MKALVKTKSGVGKRFTYKLHLVSHTHWDREWYFTFQQFRIKLVELIDRLLTILDNDPDYKFFMLDGQSVILEDYLEIRPENKERLKKYIKSGRILTGPWYVLPDLFLVSGESLIRNLLLGIKIAKDFGRVMMVGYMPDQFGFISQMPQILKGVGLDSAVIWRGIHGSPDELKSEFYWRSPDGSRILTLHLPEKYGYYSVANLPSTVKEAYEMIARVKDDIIPYATTGNLLLMNGVDHIFPKSYLPSLIKKINRLLKDSGILHSTLPRLIMDIRREHPLLDVRTGEFREGTNVDGILRGTISTRMYLKQENERLETLLGYWAEMWSGFAWMSGKDYPDKFLLEAWKILLKNHPHDSICGCSIDEAHREMMARFSQSSQIAEELVIKSLSFIAKQIQTDKILSDKETALVVFNPLNWSRSDLVRTEICFPYEYNIDNFKLLDNGKNIACHIESKEKRVIELDKTSDVFPVFPAVTKFIINFLAEEVPPCGYKVYRVVPLNGKRSISRRDSLNLMENQFMKVEIHPNGTFDLTDKENHVTYRNIHYFEDSGDAGDEYNYCWPKEDEVITSLKEKARVTLVEKNNDLITYRIDYQIKLPIELTRDRKRRKSRKIPFSISSLLTLGRTSRRLDIITELNNQVKDHRLRVLFPTCLNTDYSDAESQFDVVRRPIKLPAGKDWFEDPTPTHPQTNFVDVSDGKRGVMLANKGLTEYEVKDDKGRAIALTLLRGVEWGSRGDLLNTKRGKTEKDGKIVSNPEFMFTPEAQCLGRHAYYYSIIPHKGNWYNGLAYQEAYQHKVPMRTIQTGRHEGELPAKYGFIKIEPSSLIITAIKRCEKRNSLIVRVYNPGPKEIKVRINLAHKIKKAKLVNLLEEPVSSNNLRVEGNKCQINLGKKQIQTVEFIL